MATIQLWENANVAWQKWIMRSDGRIESVHCPGQVIDIKGGKTTNGAFIISFGDTGNWNQEWNVVNAVMGGDVKYLTN